VASVQRGQGLPAICGLLAGPVLLVATVAGALAQPDEFSIVDHANSDLSADTADSPWLSNQLGSNLPGLLLLVFAIGLWRSLERHRSARIGSILVAIAGVGVFLTGFFRLDCRQIDPGCEDSSRHAVAHNTVAGLTILALVLAPFVLARALKLTLRWRDLWVPTLAFGIGTIVAAVAGSAVGEGLGSLLAVLVWFIWIAVLAIRMLRLAAPTDRPWAPL
jgi:Protein of unknown function (DUF998)